MFRFLGLAMARSAIAQTTDPSGHIKADTATSTTAFMVPNDKPPTDMAIELSGDGDVDFIRGMTSH